MPVSPLFHLDLVACRDDIDELDHVSNLVYVRWVLRAAQAHSAAAGFEHTDYRALGSVFVVRRHEIDYLRPAFAGERIRLSTWIDSWKAASSLRMTRITRLDPTAGTSDGEVELARGQTLWAFINLASGRPTRIPENVRAAFARPVTAQADQPDLDSARDH
ncbi:MAG: acyl-CoA thioesterase [Proteobacteria bacterium]|nr:acyl-CoA thioesterase [Pseudomonadota bacterium]